MQYQLIFDAATQPLLDRVYLGVFALITVTSIFCFFVLNRKYTTINIVSFFILIVGGFSLLGISIYHRAECGRWARQGNYQIAEGPVENFIQTNHSGSKGGNITIETFSVQGVGFQCKSGIDVFNGGFHKTDGPIKPGAQVRIAYKDEQILKLWVINNSGTSYGN